GSAPLFFRDVPLVKERTVIGDYTAVRKGGSQQGLSYITLVIPKYSPLEYAYSRSSSLQINFSSFTSKLNSIQLEFYREDVEDRTTTSEVIKEIGNISLLGRAKNDNNRILRSSKTLNILKLPDKIKLKRIENGILTKEIEGILSFDSNKIDLDFTQTSEKDTEAKIYLKISKEQAEQLDDKGIYLIEGEYSSGRISKDKVLTDSVVYLGLKTDNTSDLGFDEYIYEPAIKLNIQSALVKDNSVKIALFDAGDQKPIPKNDGKNGLIRLYKTESQYSSEIEPNNYGKLVLRGYMNPYNYKRGDLSLNHTLKLTDESTTRSSSGTIDSNGGYVDLKTNLGKISIGYSKDSSIANGMGTTESMEITTFGIKEYKFTRGDIRILVDHFDNGNTMVPIYSEVLVIGIPAFEPKSWYYNESNSDKLTNNGVKYMKYFTKDKIVYPLGVVGLDQARDRGITIGEDDTIGARIEYNKKVDLEEKNNPNKKIKGKIVKLDLSENTLPKGNILSEVNILPDEDILEAQVALGIEIDLNQVGHDSSKTYVLKGDSPLDVSSDITKKPIRIGRNGHWESLVTNIELRPVVMGDLT
ncbi:hypothetical protein, partial [Cetobacterium sp.]|uniref:hypothetical protein n=1 Tax=Cetobacterium sp. TaxID=2071632 RepID=UPI003F38A37F